MKLLLLAKSFGDHVPHFFSDFKLTDAFCLRSPPLHPLLPPPSAAPFLRYIHRYGGNNTQNHDCKSFTGSVMVILNKGGPLQMKGAPRDLSAATFQIHDESHTIGNALRWMIMKKCVMSRLTLLFAFLSSALVLKLNFVDIGEYRIHISPFPWKVQRQMG